MQFYAILQDQQMKRLIVSSDIQVALEEKFGADASIFLDNKSLIEFDAGHKTEKEELFRVESYEFYGHLAECIYNPDNCEPLDPSDLSTGQIKAVLGASLEEDQISFVACKSIDKSWLIDNSKWNLKFSSQTLTQLIDSGLTIPDRVDALFSAGNLYFSSYSTAKRFLDLTQIFQEASDTDIENLLSSGPLTADSETSISQIADSWCRRRLSMISRDPIWENTPIDDICTLALEFDVEIETHTDSSGNVNLILPDNRSELKNVLKVLNEDYIKSSLSNRRYATNSKRSAD